MRPVLPYDVPAQNLVFSYQSPELKPLAQQIDTGIHWNNTGFIKAGYGNFTTPFCRLAFRLAMGLNLSSTYTAGILHPKEVCLTSNSAKPILTELAFFSSPGNKAEWTGSLFFDNNNQYQYGYQPDTLKFSKDDLKQNFTTFGGKLAVRNKLQNAAGIDYNPSMAISIFNDNHSGNESNLVINAPISKSVTKILAFDLGLTADVTTYKSDSAGTINNNLYYLTPAIAFKTPNFKVIAGITPSWDNKIFTMLPNFSAEAKINNEKLILQAGWVGYYNKTTYQYLASLNPWMQQPKFLLNTRTKELYAGFKGSAGTHVTYDAKVSYLQMANQPLFVNDTITGKSFVLVNESQMKDLRIHGEVGYTLQEKLSLLAGATFNQYSALTDNDKAWGMLPIEINGSLRWQVLKDFLVKSDVYFWDGPQYRGKDLKSYKFDPAIDLNLGVEFTITKI